MGMCIFQSTPEHFGRIVTVHPQYNPTRLVEKKQRGRELYLQGLSQCFLRKGLAAYLYHLSISPHVECDEIKIGLCSLDDIPLAEIMLY